MILYFSGTGNSLAIARRLSERLNEQVISLYEAAGKDLTHEKRIGLVFPTYNLEAPKAVRALVPQLRLSPSAYVWIVITCGAQTNNSIWTVRRLLRKQGVRVSYCHKIRVPDSSAIAFGRNPNDQAWKFDKFASRLTTIGNELASDRKRLHFAGFDPFGWLISHTRLEEKMGALAQPRVNEAACIGCGICAKVCPQKNIMLTSRDVSHASATALIGERCTWCLSCVHFCPQQSIMVNRKTIAKEQQYHHPDIKLNDLIKR